MAGARRKEAAAAALISSPGGVAAMVTRWGKSRRGIMDNGSRKESSFASKTAGEAQPARLCSFSLRCFIF